MFGRRKDVSKSGAPLSDRISKSSRCLVGVKASDDVSQFGGEAGPDKLEDKSWPSGGLEVAMRAD